MRGNGKRVFAVIKALMGDKLPEQMRDSLSVLLEGDENLQRVIDRMHYNCEFDLAANIAFLTYLLDPQSAGEWIDLLVEDFNLDNRPDHKPKYGHGDYRFIFGTILAIFKIANDLTLYHSEVEGAEEVLKKLPDLIYKLIINEGPMHRVVDNFLFGMSSEPIKTLNKFKSSLATEITAFIRDRTESSIELREQEIMTIIRRVKQSKRVFDKNSIGGLILDQICYAKFGDLGPMGRAMALEQFLREL